MIWTGRVVSALPAFAMLLSAAFALRHFDQVIAGMKKFGYDEGSLRLVLTLEIVAPIIYLIPRTAVLGAILLTGYFGGAVATHVRIHDPGYPTALICGVLTWLRLYLRDARRSQLVPFRAL